MELDAPMAHIIRGILMVGATGIVQVVAQLALSHMMDVLPPQHRMIGAFESAAGMMMFGWSTALLVAVVVRTDRRVRP